MLKCDVKTCDSQMVQLFVTRAPPWTTSTRTTQTPPTQSLRHCPPSASAGCAGGWRRQIVDHRGTAHRASFGDYCCAGSLDLSGPLCNIVPRTHTAFMAAVQEAPAADATTTTTAAATAPAAASSSSPIQANTTVLSTLHNLLRAHVAAHPSPTQPYLHPYAPLPASAWKGKAKAELLSQPQQADALQAIRKTLEGAKAVLGKRENDRLRLTRAMKEVWVLTNLSDS